MDKLEATSGGRQGFRRGEGCDQIFDANAGFTEILTHVVLLSTKILHQIWKEDNSGCCMVEPR